MCYPSSLIPALPSSRARFLAVSRAGSLATLAQSWPQPEADVEGARAEGWGPWRAEGYGKRRVVVVAVCTSPSASSLSRAKCSLDSNPNSQDKFLLAATGVYPAAPVVAAAFSTCRAILEICQQQKIHIQSPIERLGDIKTQCPPTRTIYSVLHRFKNVFHKHVTEKERVKTTRK